MRVIIVQAVGRTDITHPLSGGEYHVIEVANEWLKRGNDVHYITNVGNNAIDNYADIVSTIKIPTLSAFGLFFNFFIQKKNLKKTVADLLTEDQTTVLITPFPVISNIFALFYLSHFYKIKAAVYFYHLIPPPWWHPSRRGGLIRLVTSYALNQLALALTKLGGMLPAMCHPEELQESYWNFSNGIMRIDITGDNIFDGDNSHTSKEFDICFVGSLREVKGIFDLLEAIHEVLSVKPDIRVFIAGKAESKKLEKKVLQLLRDFRLENNVFVTFNYLSKLEMRTVLIKSKLFIYPSYEEGWSLNVMEAAISGALPITYDIRAYDYLGPDAVKVKTGDVKGLARAIISLLDNDQMRETLSLRLSAKCMSYDIKQIANYELSTLIEFSNLNFRRDSVHDVG